jgi:hypothetical protein
LQSWIRAWHEMNEHDRELLRQAILKATGKEDSALEELLVELLDMEQQVAHMARPHRILLNIEERLKQHLGVE